MWECLICNKKVKDIYAHFEVKGHYAFESEKHKNKSNEG